jgi:hypothetical protein
MLEIASEFINFLSNIFQEELELIVGQLEKCLWGFNCFLQEILLRMDGNGVEAMK